MDPFLLGAHAALLSALAVRRKALRRPHPPSLAAAVFRMGLTAVRRTVQLPPPPPAAPVALSLPSLDLPTLPAGAAPVTLTVTRAVCIAPGAAGLAEAAHAEAPLPQSNLARAAAGLLRTAVRVPPARFEEGAAERAPPPSGLGSVPGSPPAGRVQDVWAQRGVTKGEATRAFEVLQRVAQDCPRSLRAKQAQEVEWSAAAHFVALVATAVQHGAGMGVPGRRRSSVPRPEERPLDAVETAMLLLAAKDFAVHVEVRGLARAHPPTTPASSSRPSPGPVSPVPLVSRSATSCASTEPGTRRASPAWRF